MTRAVSEDQMGMLAVFVAAGADPRRLADWFARSADVGDVPVATIAEAAEELRHGSSGFWLLGTDLVATAAAAATGVGAMGNDGEKLT